ncbi:MAG: class I SAM-dependent methyltransferase [Fibrobacteres bacterium]|nr:class I SAM-dependent methyltransferase [Fibrobacterota bacterium]
MILRNEQNQINKALSLISVPTNGLALDIASGVGHSTFLMPVTKTFVSMDFSFGMVSIQKRSNKDLLCINANALRIPLKDNSVDYAQAIGLTEYFQNKELALFSLELSNVLKVSGKLLITFTPSSLFGIGRQLVGSKIYLRKKEEIISIFAKNGFKHIAHFSIYTQGVIVFEKS